MKTSETALVVIDVQKESGFSLRGMDGVVRNTQRMIEACRAAGIPVIYTRQINRRDGIGLSLDEPRQASGEPHFYADNRDSIEIVDEIRPQKTDIVIDKYRWSAFFETSLDLMLKSLGVKNLIIGGVVTDGCLMTSVFDAYFRDYRIQLVHDMCTASNEGAHMAAMLHMANWVYSLEVLNTDNMINCVEGHAYAAWQADDADALQFTPETLRETFATLTAAANKQ
ncbi:cysteine hydrolase [Chromohalobacter sp. TMW 2.2308]|uniref:Cysteine hydrolase n=1 Tax=Chromohalobacter moromii TaxID=2860329 RepID=A0A9X2X0B9_9GAMM|nr:MULTISPECIES: isochorismatase family cysteine hydrolase [Chromohalobacter]MCK2041631.1 cysteine hydrolase [Chromohalobacter moromii]MCK2044568.1 cysteine hydrolase [Chromohalobacter moromii]MCT8504278.1 cysteine hydrolase [Chromohalobacter moromii]MCT8513779.1 cysteine hydrolase [Chromohalobacter sp. TMW 2.2271]